MSSAEPLRVGVIGARGRMGAEVCRAVEAAGDMEVVAMVDAGAPEDSGYAFSLTLLRAHDGIAPC